MEKIIIRPDELRRIARILHGSSKRIKAALDSVDQAVSGIGPENFSGQGAESLRKRYAGIQVRLGMANIQIILMAKQLEKIAKGFEDKDKALAAPNGRPIDNSEDGMLFVKGSSDVTTIHPSDITQGLLLGDCYLLATLAAMAKADPDLIRQMIKINADGTYTVRFFNEETGKEEFVTVNKKDIPHIFGYSINAQKGDGGELWPAIIEKAYAKWIYERHNGVMEPGGSTFLEKIGIQAQTDDYKAIDGGLLTVATQLTGRPIWGVEPSAMTEFMLINNIEKGNLITLGTPPEAKILPSQMYLFQGNGAPLVPSHAYYVLGYDSKTGMVEIGNPWGWDDTVSIQLSELKIGFPQIQITEVL